MSYKCDCLWARPNSNKGQYKPVNTYCDGICENCHNYAIWDMGRYKDHVDADLDITKSETCVSNWHRGIVKKPVKTYIQRMSEEEKQVIVDDLKKGVPVPIIIESRKASGKIVRRLASENGVILKRGAVPRKLLKLHRSAV